jgi:hypothetical protein
VATYESFAGLKRGHPLTAGLVVADEVHLVADPERGPVVEALLSQLRGRAQGPLAGAGLRRGSPVRAARSSSWCSRASACSRSAGTGRLRSHSRDSSSREPRLLTFGADAHSAEDMPRV